MSGLVKAQDSSLLDRFIAGLSEGCITMEVAYEAGVNLSGINGNGTLVIQDEAWRISGNGIDICCDGTSMWILDPDLKEAYVQEPAFQPAAVLRDFSVSGSCRSDHEKDVVVYDLLPLSDPDMRGCTLRIRNDGRLHSCDFVMSDGSVVKVKVTDMKRSDRKDISFFRPIFDSSWVVTDLR